MEEKEKKKEPGVFLAFGVLAVILLANAALAATSCLFDDARINLLQKDPATWQPVPFVPDWATGQWFAPEVTVTLKGGVVKVYGQNLPGNTAYTLIYYGDATHNDVWPYATCLIQGKTTAWGTFGTFSKAFNYAPFLTDGKAEKFWLVRSADVNCALKQMTAWNPTTIFFEDHTV